MTFAASVISVVAGVGSQVMGAQAAKRAANQQASASRAQAEKLRDRYTHESSKTNAEIESLRTMRSMDLQAFRQASETAVIQAQKGAERMQRQRTMGRLAPDVRSAIFGGEFKQYVGREMQKLGQYASLTEKILAVTERQQDRAMQIEGQAGSMELQGELTAIQTKAAAGDLGANILGAVGSAASGYAAASAAKSAGEARSLGDFKQAAALDPDIDMDEIMKRMQSMNTDQFRTFFQGTGQ
jgi:hypothetical protein